MSANLLFSADDPVRSLVLKAGAGAGKTQALMGVYLKLLEEGPNGTSLTPSEIVAITFTRKAAAEIRRRIRVEILKRIHERGPEPWEACLEAFDSAPVGTFHTLGQRILREYALECGYSPQFGLLETEQADRLLEEAVQEVLLDSVRGGSVLAVAWLSASGAGSSFAGLCEIVIGMAKLARGLGWTANRLADWEPDAKRIRQELVATIIPSRDELLNSLRAERSAAGKALTAKLGKDKKVNWLARAEGIPLEDLGRAFHEVIPDDLIHGKTSDTAKLVALLDAYATFIADPERELRYYREMARLLAETLNRYAKAKRGVGRVDFDDLIDLPVELLQKRDDIRNQLRQEWRFLLIDEFQDTNHQQAHLVYLLASPPGTKEIDSDRLFLVGDPKQSIYRFRAAEVSLFAAFGRRIDRMAALSANRRSVPQIVDLANRLAQWLFPDRADQPSYTVRSGPEDQQEPYRPQVGPAVECLNVILPGTEKASAHLLRLWESRTIVRRILELKGDLPGQRPSEVTDVVTKHPREDIRFGDIAVLYRVKHVRRYLEAALEEAGIPYRIAEKGSIWSRREVRDLLRLLRWLALDQSLDLVAVLRSPLVGLSDDALHRLLAGRKEDILDLRALQTLAQEPHPDLEPLRRALTWLQPLRTRRDHFTPDEILRLAVEGSGFRALMAQGAAGAVREAAIDQMIRLAGTPPGRPAVSLREFIFRIEDAGVSEPETGLPFAGTDAVTLSTIHSAKGLEWPIVIAADLGYQGRSDSRPAFLHIEHGPVPYRLPPEPGNWYARANPLAEGSREDDKLRDQAELKRLLYVLVTRARDALILPFTGANKGLAALLLDSAVLEGLPRNTLELNWPLPAPPAEVGTSAPEAAASFAPTLSRVGPRTFSATALVGFERCERRYFYQNRLGLEGEHLSPPEVVHASESGSGASRRMGTLAHEVLARVELGPAAPGMDLEALAQSIRKREPDLAPTFEKTLGRIRQFLTGSLGQDVQRAEKVERELPVLVPLPGREGRFLRGKVDLLARMADGRLLVLDYKTGPDRPEKSLEYHRLQLEIYALAADRLHLADWERIVPGLVLLHDPDQLAGLTSSGAVSPRLEVESRLAGLLDALETREEKGDDPETWSKVTRHPEGTGYRLHPRERGDCDRDRCPFVRICWK